MPKKQVDADNESVDSVESQTDDLIKSLVEKYAGKATQGDEIITVPVTEVPLYDSGSLCDRAGTKFNDDANEEEQPSQKKTRKRNPPTQKQLDHLAKTRELAVQKRKEYAAKRREDKEKEEKEAMEAELEKVADKKLREKLRIVMAEVRAAEENARKESKPVVVSIESKPKRTVASSQSERAQTKFARKPTPIPRAVRRKPTPVPRKQVRRISIDRDDYTYPSNTGRWDDYSLW